jgi:phthalate 4,5-dioxygenase
MLSREDNDILCRVGPGTPMGNLLREYWIPAFISEELEVDGFPRRVRILGEDLIAYRDNLGRVGVVDENCPHRGSSMIFARNEEGGLRCAYHGWKFDCTGACVDMPSEGQASNFQEKVKIKAYRTQERNGLVWLYMGPRKDPPPLQELQANLEPPAKPGSMYKYVRQCNWAQALEGSIDTVHINYLHARLDQKSLRDIDGAPELEVHQTDYGFFYGAKRKIGDGRNYWRVRQFIMPWYTTITGPGGILWIPMDDYNTLVVEWNPARPPDMPRDYDDLSRMETARQPWGYKPDNYMIPWGNWRVKADVENEWMRDRSLERDKLYLGIYSNPLQDSAVQVTMGAIYDRRREHLGTTDQAIITVRRQLIDAAKALRDRGEIPATVDNPHLSAVRGTECVLPDGMDWVKTTEPWREACNPGPPVEYASPGLGMRIGERQLAPPPLAQF